ncbi:2-succinyl-5-enolpyruvyl-6-hydroxy-3-cyclohexene-1-carboxylic-acid synthase [Humibacter sp. RRB41]|uniref:2-succinyl-5-enolpyruvyl-6-hydroxy-3- cyclohexene-1-carboxylic-acid synthase n=1 Tax=Humibacter sp. RRB41 TaxID=2919946 RepID=UPI001FAADE16|nr:2-succinyl-5-enolpyruvyl-6-hydroxy-3-cyclohexene-1-carboxylic-acid synthase [Humibacter sp. RRB41]
MPEPAHRGDSGTESVSTPSSLPATGNPATDASLALLVELVRRGLKHIVLSPGSRSQALALVAAELERVGAVELHVRVDERVGGFLALGLAVEGGRPAAVITTSGTATANLLPAVLEAHHSNVPMIVLTADRPVQLRGIRSNQTTVQAGMYGAAVRRALDVDAPTGADDETDAYARLAAQAWSAALDDAGPVHLNLAFREPLSVAVPDLTDVAGPAALVTETTLDDETDATPPAPLGRAHLVLEPGIHTVVIAGHAAGPAAEELARTGGWPLIAEASSGSRFGPNLVVAYRELLNDAEFGGAVERAIVFGHPTLSREIPALLSRDGVEVIVVAPVGEEVYDPARSAKAVASVEVRDSDPRDREARAWVGRWVFASRALLDDRADVSADEVSPDVEAGRSHSPQQRLAFAKAEFAAVRAPVTRRMLAEALWRFTWPHDRLVLGASRLIRELDAAVPGKRISVHANRGLAGIDGTISTAIGIGLASQRPDTDAPHGTTRVLLGDLALLHDVGALLFGDGERRPTVQVVVGDDDGGTIFDSLEVATTAPPEAMRRVLTTPQQVEWPRLAEAYGWSYRRVTTRGELDQALSAPPRGTSIVHVPLTH